MPKKFKQEHPKKVEETLQSKGKGKEGYFYKALMADLDDLANYHAGQLESYLIKSVNTKPGEESITFGYPEEEAITEDF